MNKRVMEEILKRGSKPAWVKVSDRLPELFDDGNRLISKNVLVSNGEYALVAYYWKYPAGENYSDADLAGDWTEFGRDGYHCDNVTHWMDLPAIPEDV